MKQEEALKVMYGIENEVVLNRIHELQRYISRKINRNWSYLYIVELLYSRIEDKDMQDLILEYLGHETVCSFDKALDIVFSLKTNDEILEILGDYWKGKQNGISR